jgi:hypothetical protein
MNTIFGESFKYALIDSVTYQDIINQYLLDSNLDDEVLVICRNQTELLAEFIELCDRVYRFVWSLCGHLK